jgi:hypothetical protein
MREVYKRSGNDSGPNYILDLDGPDGNVYYLWGLIENLLGEECIEESKEEGGYDGVLHYCLRELGPDPIGIEFRMHGHEVGQVSDYHYAKRQHGIV